MRTSRSFLDTPRSRTEGARELSRVVRLPVVDYPTDVERPKTRGDCVDGPRPCPWVSCRHHLAIEVTRSALANESSPDSVKFIFPGVELEDMNDTCSLDVADAGGVSLDAAALTMNVTRERLRQIESKALARIRGEVSSSASLSRDERDAFREESDVLADFAPTGPVTPADRTGTDPGYTPRQLVIPEAAPEEPTEEPVRIASFIEAGLHDKEWGARVYRAYERRLVDRGLIVAAGKVHPRAEEVLNMVMPMAEDTKKIRAARDELRAKFGREPTSEEVAQVTGIAVARCGRKLRDLARVNGSSPRPASKEAPKARKLPPAPARVARGGSLEDALRAELERIEERRSKIVALLEDFGGAA